MNDTTRRTLLWGSAATGLAVATVLVPDRVVRSLEIGTSFFYEALWPILLGVLITAAIETFVDKDRMAEVLGGSDVGTTAKATGLGALSSACTFGAVTITQTLFKKGASKEATLAFSFASTNIVFELGILIYILLGPVFLAAEILGGFLLIAIMYLLVRAFVPDEVFEEARERLRGAESDDDDDVRTEDPFCGYTGREDLTYTHDGVTYRFHSEACLEGFKQQVAATGRRRDQLRGAGGWYRIGVNYFNTMDKIYQTVLLGFLLAGFIVGLVPTEFWSGLFLEPTSFLGVTENAVLGVLAGVVSFIGSIGNVPFAAALWVSGVSFAGVVALIYADLITIPVLQLWSYFFGRKVMWYVFAIFGVTMAVAAIVMEYTFAAFDLIPPRPDQADLIELTIHLDPKLVVTLLLLALTAALWGIVRRQRNRAEQVSDDEGVRDPVCGALVDPDGAAATRQRNGTTLHFDTEWCARAFDRDPSQVDLVEV
jgi:uncharacterized membrane protein YraQ (UPF0718 family)